MTDAIPALARWKYLDPEQQHQIIHDGRSTFIQYQAFTARIQPAEALTIAALLTIELLEHHGPAAARAYYSGLTRRVHRQ